jgi:hypothetical protein
MRHEGYLAGSYVRLTDDEVRRQFHEHEDALYITRRDRRHSENVLEVLRKEKDQMQAKFRDDIFLLQKRVEELERKT